MSADGDVHHITIAGAIWLKKYKRVIRWNKSFLMSWSKFYDYQRIKPEFVLNQL